MHIEGIALRLGEPACAARGELAMVLQWSWLVMKKWVVAVSSVEKVV